MKVIEPGHIYELSWLDLTDTYRNNVGNDQWFKENSNRIVFVNREQGTEHPGTQTQEVIRALIDRTKHCDKCLRWEGNDKIIYHLRMALALHESRAIERKTEKGYIAPESIEVGVDGHFKIREDLNAIALSRD